MRQSAPLAFAPVDLLIDVFFARHADESKKNWYRGADKCIPENVEGGK